MRRWAVLVGVSVTSALAGGPAQAQEAAPPVVFADDKPVTGTCADLAEKDAEIQIWNETGTQQRVTIEFEPRNGAASSSLEEACGDLVLEKPGNLESIAGETVALRPAEGATLKLSAKDGDDSGSYSGALVIYGNGSRVARKKIEIAEPETSRTLEALPETEKAEAKMTTSEKGVLWVAVEAKEKSYAADGKGRQRVTLGSLSGPGDPIAVIWRGSTGTIGPEDSANPDISTLGLELEGDLEPGSYSGGVDLAPNDEEKGTVALEVKVRKGLEWVGGLILAGILLGGILTLINAGVLPAARLRSRVAALTGRHEKAIASLKEGAPTAPEGTEEVAVPGNEKKAPKHWSEIEIGDLGALQVSLCERIAEAKKKALISMDKTFVANLDTEITGIEQQIDLLKKIPPFAQEVEKALRLPRPTELPPPTGDREAKPKRETRAKEAITGGQLKAEEVKARIDRMEAAAKEVRELREEEAELEILWVGTTELSESDEKKELEDELGDVREQVWALVEADEKKELTKQFRTARQKLARLSRDQPNAFSSRSSVHWAASGTGGMEQLIRMEELVPPSGDVEVRDRILAASLAAAAEPATPPAAVKDVTAQPMDKDSAKEILNTAVKVQGAIVVLTGLLALATGIKALYGDTWGTPLDCLGAFLWGVVGQALVTNLTTSIDEWSGLRWLRRG
jgi:hypothetical protein